MSGKAHSLRLQGYCDGPVSPSGKRLEVGWHDVSHHLDFNGRLTNFSLVGRLRMGIG